MPFTETALNTGVDAIAARASHMSLHSADPGTTGVNELTGGSYARKAPTFAVSSGGVKQLSADVVFDIPAGATVAYIGYWDTTTFLGSNALAVAETFTNAGTFTASATDNSFALS